MLAEVAGVDQQALLAALHLEDELGDRGVGDRFEGVADAAVDGVDAADRATSIWPFRAATRSGSGWEEERR